MSWAVTLDDVGRRYRAGGRWVLRGVDLEVRAGTLLRVEGGNGSGKSTLLRLLAGVEAPSAGRIRGLPGTRGYVPERFPAALPLTAAAYVTHLGRVRGLRGRAAARESTRWLERLGAGPYAGTRMRELSKGSSQKVAVAQALVGRPALLVLDEAWTGLDQSARAVLDEVVRERVAEGGAVVFVEHDPARLAAAPDAVVRIAAGGLAERAERGPRARAGTEPRPRTPRLRIEARGTPGAGAPAGLPRGARCRVTPEGVLSLTVPAAASDAALRTLLAAHPGWHVRSVREEDAAREEDAVQERGGPVGPAREEAGPG
ncbi:ATP-binding cassette domain-containing protein [Streptomyces reniochalinae]|uniref:ABC transporter ATP-binding protein n=1 Tax=Streptomyces reniochalinae TaxID=2250578 RepID=A0A367EDY8_9ACTN|nr:ATP-binding cassette domain-containing protein [Streptomyces reniochalinae]RCG15855.1 ABC transporter ATP-binding protein [Streptomyces reniochalinae]